MSGMPRGLYLGCINSGENDGLSWTDTILDYSSGEKELGSRVCSSFSASRLWIQCDHLPPVPPMVIPIIQTTP